jgi:SAM-dependent methyltransferase
VVTREGTYWHDIGEQWLATARQRLWRAHHDRVIAHWLGRWHSPVRGDRVFKTDLFEEAIGPGLLPVINTAESLLVGADISASIVRSAIGHPELAVIQADVRRLPFADESFDCVVSTSTLDHFATPVELRACLRQLVRLLRPSGRLLITLDNLSNPVVRLRNALPGGPLQSLGLVPYRIGASCNRRGFIRLLDDCGTEVTDLTAILHCPRMPMVQIAGIIDRLPNGRRLTQSLLKFLWMWEVGERWPSRFLTGYYLAACAVRR